MPNHGQDNGSRIVRFLFDNSLFLIGGAVVALVWANVDIASYRAFVYLDVSQFVRPADAGHADPGQHTANAVHPEASSEGHGLTLHFIVNDILMALFFAMAAKEVWESMLPGGALSNPRRAATPLLATVGGLVGPAVLYILGTLLIGQSGWFGQAGDLGRGWAVPCATDIAFSFLVARLIFGPGHPAIAFLLLLAIADDAAGLIILAVAYPQALVRPVWLLLAVAAVVVALLLRRQRLRSFWWYLLIPGTLSWCSFHFAGIHPALGLVPIIPCLPHAHSDLGIFAREELNRPDTLSDFEHWWKRPVEVFLGLFGLVNAGVVLGNFGAPTGLVLLGLILGKPLGITLFTWIAARVFKLEIPGRMSYRHVFTLGTVAGIGFTVALFMSEAAFPADQFPGDLRDAVKMGALASLLAALVAFAVARLLGIRPPASHESAA